MTYNELAELLKQEGGELEVSFKIIDQNEVVFGNNNPRKDVITLKNDDIKWYSDKEQPVSEELEEAAIQFATDTETGKVDVVKQSSFFWGAIYHKQQMMAKAVDGEIGYWNIRGLSVNTDLPSTVEEGDKVKVIVIKED